MSAIDSSGWGVAEWTAIITALSVVVGAITGLIMQFRQLRNENSEQHAEGRAISNDIRDRLLNLHETVDHIDEKVDDVAENLMNHEKTYHRPRRW